MSKKKNKKKNIKNGKIKINYNNFKIENINNN